jgi:hypothetical protein
VTLVLDQPRAAHSADIQRSAASAPLRIGLVDDPVEHEANRVAERLVGSPAPGGLLQRVCACGGTPGPDGGCAECKAKRLDPQRRAAGVDPSTAPQSVHETLRSPGVPLDRGTRSSFERRLGGLLAHELAGVCARRALPLQPSAPEVETAQGGDMEVVTSLEEDFVPEEFAAVPDEDLTLERVGDAAEVTESGAGVAAPETHFVDLGRTGTRRFGDADAAPLLSPRAFTNGGRTGTVVWAGGGGAGAHGNEPAGSIQWQVNPVYDAAPNPTPPKFDGWVRWGTGGISVTRSWVGINSGDQGNGHYVTAAAAARINAHEVQHVNSTSGLYNTHLNPLVTRISNYRQAGNGVNIGISAADAQARVRTAVGWQAAITAFQNADRAANQPGGTVDTADLGSGTYPVDAGPGTVGGVAFNHRVRTQGEPNPPP